jgi:hypothetical protein
MPIALLIAGVVLVLAGAQGQVQNLGAQLEEDFTGTNNFGVWLLAIFGVGAIGYIPKAKPFSDAFLALIVVSIFLADDKNGQGFFKNIQNAVQGIGIGNSSTTSTTSTTTSTSTATSDLYPLYTP